MRYMAYLLAKAGWQVRALSTNLTEGNASTVFPASAGVERAASPFDAAQTLVRIHDEGVEFEIIELGQDCEVSARKRVCELLDRHYSALLSSFRPDLLLTFGGTAADVRRRALARTSNVPVVFALHNLAYLRAGLQEFDHLLVPSKFMAARYTAAGYRNIQHLPPPIWDRDVTATQKEPIFFTFVNPERAKGAELIANLAARNPDLPFLIVESRAHRGHFMTIAEAAGIDAQQAGNVMYSPGAVLAKDIFAVTRALLMPSLVDEAAGRLAAEALANGIPALVSDAGALPEIVGAGGIVLPFKRRHADIPVIDNATIDLWSEQLLVLAHDHYYHPMADTAQSAGRRYTTAHQIKCYTDWFASCLT